MSDPSPILDPFAPPDDELIVATYNVQKGLGLDMRRDPARTARVIGELGADVVALQEADRRFGDRAGVLDLDALREITGLMAVPMPSRSGRLAHGWHGNLVLIRDAEIEDVRPITLPGLEPRGAIQVDLRIGPHPLRIVAAHLGLLRGSRLIQARALAEAHGRGDGRPTVLLGDLNEWRIGRRSSLLPLTRAMGGHVAPGAPSFPARMPMLALDRVLTCTAAQVLEIAPHDSPLARIASDHLPVRARLRLPRPRDGRPE
jgi:endonuclease/exonuclease/phosphatase family metal-dependent hydrolase